MMQRELESEGLGEFRGSVPLLLGLMISVSFSIGMWVTVWWVGSLIAH